MSGRALRRLPVLAHARYIGLAYSTGPLSSESTPAKKSVNGTSRKSSVGGGAPSGVAIGGMRTQVEVWLGAMERVVENHSGELRRLES